MAFFFGYTKHTCRLGTAIISKVEKDSQKQKRDVVDTGYN